ncbi:sulfite reductase subunit alpha [Rubellicoccus peritrichatus]|uniref:assimilatory sulfite reductase (NADPH) n=1 Tax=Rubellicoccus peritrichatus TaxID=3080537 RepID=A0AAQ3L6E3_9BACT|nr:sulfite reductase subunit alpha [Puniceicoccus sp. CR14]WOO39911.1 sulfite reductase subunit alpha [Puniceicoccus sp. CR14]
MLAHNPPSTSVPFIPDNAPFSEEQRAWLNGFLAGLYSTSGTSAPVEEKPATPLSILFGSQTGNAESLAKKTAKEANAKGFVAEVFDMEDYPQDRLKSDKNLLIITSTYGEGEPPDNAEALHSLLLSDEAPRLEGARFSVLGLGDSNYPDFNKCAKEFDKRLEELGAERVTEAVHCDTDFDDDYASWLEASLGSLSTGDNSGTSTAPATTTSTPSETTETNDGPIYGRKNPFPATLKSNFNLNKEGSAKETRHVEIVLEGSDLEYEAGDALAVKPHNCSTLVDEILEATGFSGEEKVTGSDDSEVTLKEALTSHYDICALNKLFLANYASFADHPTLNEMLANGNGHIDGYLTGRHIIDPLSDFPAKFPSAEDLVGMLKKLAPRLYSISSSPKAHPGEVHLTVGAVRYETHGRARKGVCSTFLADLSEGDTVSVYVQPNKHFRPPADSALPMIMVGPGTGIAPFRAFLEERNASGASGKNWLFFGDQKSEFDFLYADQLAALENESVLHRLDTAFSRDTDQKVYVQDRMRENAEELFQWLEEGGHFYVCGDASRMAKDVDRALHEIVETVGKKSSEEAVAYIDQLKSDKRYLRDVY